MNLKLLPSKGHALLCAIFLCLILQSCQKELLVANSTSKDFDLSISQAKEHFIRQVLVKKSNNGLLANLNTKTPLWEKAVLDNLNGYTVVKVPLSFDKVYWGLFENAKAYMPYEKLNYLFLYKDSTNKINTEWVSLFPDSSWSYGNRKQYSGRIVIRDWTGVPQKAYSYDKSQLPKTFSVGNSNQHTSLVGVNRNEKLMAGDPVMCWSFPVYGVRDKTYVNNDGVTCAVPGETETYLVGFDMTCMTTSSLPGGTTTPGGTSTGSPNGNPSAGSPNPYNYPPSTCNPDPSYIKPPDDPAHNIYYAERCDNVPTPVANPNPEEEVPTEGYTYSLTQADLDIIDNIKQEDVQADNYIALEQKPGCYGTSRMGNIKFNGTLEHWIIQLDYMTSNISALREYSIPGSSGNARRGFADIVNVASQEIFEIKPVTVPIATALSEVQTYVDMANIHCPPMYGQWQKGTGYFVRVWPHPAKPGKFLKAELTTAGVIQYTILDAYTGPVPSFAFAPQEILNKLRNLVSMLTANTAYMEQKIVTYLRQHPEMIGYLKTAAVAIVIGTIIEDIATAGVGIADDWASFLVARTIWRVAAAM